MGQPTDSSITECKFCRACFLHWVIYILSFSGVCPSSCFIPSMQCSYFCLTTIHLAHKDLSKWRHQWTQWLETEFKTCYIIIDLDPWLLVEENFIIVLQTYYVNFCGFYMFYKIYIIKKLNWFQCTDNCFQGTEGLYFNWFQSKEGISTSASVSFFGEPTLFHR